MTYELAYHERPYKSVVSKHFHLVRTGRRESTDLLHIDLSNQVTQLDSETLQTQIQHFLPNPLSPLLRLCVIFGTRFRSFDERSDSIDQFLGKGFDPFPFLEVRLAFFFVRSLFLFGSLFRRFAGEVGFVRVCVGRRGGGRRRSRSGRDGGFLACYGRGGIRGSSGGCARRGRCGVRGAGRGDDGRLDVSFVVDRRLGGSS